MLTQNYAIASRRISYGRNRNVQAARAASATLGPVSTTLLLMVIVGVLALLYLTQITKTSVYGYEVNSLSAQRQSLIERQQELEVEAARLSSIAHIRSSRVVGSLQPEQSARFNGTASTSN